MVKSPLDHFINDEKALALRNQSMAEVLHRTPLRHRVRHYLLRALATAYVPASRRAAATDRILVIRPDHLGDVLLTTPAIHALRAHYPNTEIHALVGPWSASVLESNPAVDQVLTLQFPGFVRGSKAPDWRSPYRFAVRTAQHLRRIGYAKAFIFRPDHWWGAWLALLTGIPVRIGYDTRDTALFLTDSLAHDGGHAVEKALRLVEHDIGPVSAETAPYTYTLTDTNVAYITGYLDECRVPTEQKLMCIHPGSGARVKLWEAEKWAEVADVLSEQLNMLPVFTGTDHEFPLISEITAKMKTPAVVMAGDTDVNQLAALFNRAGLVMGPDSGPLHLAVALGIPTVSLYGPADPVEFGPWGDRARHAVLSYSIACRPCRILDWSDDDPRYHPCVRKIGVGQVLEAARRVVNGG